MTGGCTKGVGVAERLVSALFGIFLDLVALPVLVFFVFFFAFAVTIRLFDAREILLKPSHIWWDLR